MERSAATGPCRHRATARSSASPKRSARASNSERDMAEIKKVGVLGGGLMGGGIAQVSAAAGYDTMVRDVSQAVGDRARAGTEKTVAKFVGKGNLQGADSDPAVPRLHF